MTFDESISAAQQRIIGSYDAVSEMGGTIPSDTASMTTYNLPTAIRTITTSTPYVLPVASSSLLGGIKLGDRFSLNNDNQLLISELQISASQIEDDVGYATEDWVESKNYLTAHQSLDGYATQSWVESKNYLTSHLSLDGYATESWVQGKNYLTAVPSDVAMLSDVGADVIVEHSEYLSWGYRRWKSGVLEQWGHNTYETTATYTITLPMPYENTEYVLVMTPQSTATIGSAAFPNCLYTVPGNKTLSSFTIHGGSTSSSGIYKDKYWYTIGRC